MCGVCDKAIEGDCLVSKGKHFHQECMEVWLAVESISCSETTDQCSVCGETLRGTYFTSKDKLICEKDYQVGSKLIKEVKKKIDKEPNQHSKEYE